jgi:hypothetical protein
MRTTLAVVVLLAASPAIAGDGPPPGANAVRLVVGERLELCGERALLTCPVTRFICDDPKVATVELGTAGKPAALVGVGPGQTTCAIFGFEGSGRRILEVAVGKSAGK